MVDFFFLVATETSREIKRKTTRNARYQTVAPLFHGQETSHMNTPPKTNMSPKKGLFQ